MVDSTKPARYPRDALHGEKLETIKEFIESLGPSEKINFERLEHAFSLLSEELGVEEERNSTLADNVCLERESIKGLNTRRSEMEILAVILKTALESTRKTEILYEANLSGHQLKKYLNYLVSAGFLKKKDKKSQRGNAYSTTPKGRLFLYHWTKIISLLESNNRSL